jgi:hypothetical protein
MRPLTDAERAGLTRIVDTVERLDTVTEGYSTKCDARLTGFTMHVKFAKKVASISDALAYQQLVEQSPGLLLTCAKRILEADPAAVSSPRGPGSEA